MEADEGRPRGVSGMAYLVDQFLRDHLGRPYRLILAAGLVVSIVGALNNLEKAFGSAQNVAEGVVIVIFQAALLLNQLAQVHEWRRERRARRKA